MLTVFALGNSDVTHTFFLFLAFLVFVFLIIEARRYSLFTYSRNRVLMLERGFHGRSMLAEVDTQCTPTVDIWPVAKVGHCVDAHDVP